MNIRRLLLSLPLLSSPAFVQASDNIQQGSSAILSIRHHFESSHDPLPQDILNLLSYTLTELEGHGAWLYEGAGKRWVPVTKMIESIKAFGDAPSSEADIMAILESKDKINESLLLVLSVEWKKNLEDLMARKKQEHGGLHKGKAYAAAFLAYYTIELSAARTAALDAASKAVSKTASNAPWDAAYKAPWRAAVSAAMEPANAAMEVACCAACDAASNNAREAAKAGIRPSVVQKLEILGPESAHDIGAISYELAEIFTLLWLTENGGEYMKKAFEAAYGQLPEMEFQEVKSVIEAAINSPELTGNIFIEALWRDLGAVEKFVLAK